METSLTRERESINSIAVGRKRTNFDNMPGRFPAGTFERMDQVLAPGEKRVDFVRSAVEKEIRRREVALSQKGGKGSAKA